MEISKHLNNHEELLVQKSHELIEEEKRKLIEIKKILNNKMRGQSGFEFFKKWANFSKELEEEFGKDTLIKTQLYHIMTGSGPRDEKPLSNLPYFDVGEGKIEEFIRGEKTGEEKVEEIEDEMSSDFK